MDFILNLIDIFLDDLKRTNIESYILISLIFIVSFYISKKMQATFFRLCFFILGLYFISTWRGNTLIQDIDIIVGTAFIFPHLKYFLEYIKNTILSIINFFYSLYLQLKYATINSYYFFITIYYKFLRLINWFKELLFAIKIFFRRDKQEYEDYSNHNSKKEENNFSSDDSYDKEYRHSNSYNYENNRESSYKEYSKDYEDYSYSSNSEYNSYHEESEKEFNQDDSTKNIDDEFKQFYSPSAYIVLGVSSEDDIKTIKKTYKTLIRIYHPDINQDNIELYTEISQNINEAYEKLKKIHG